MARHQINPNERESRLSFICYVMFKRIKLLKRCELYSLCSLVGPYHVPAHKGFCFLEIGYIHIERYPWVDFYHLRRKFI